MRAGTARGRARTPRTGGPSGDYRGAYTARPPAAPKSARASTRPSPRDLTDGGSDGIQARLASGHMLSESELQELQHEDLLQRLSDGHMPTADEMEKLKSYAVKESALVEAAAIAERLQNGHLITSEEQELLQQAAASAGGLHGPRSSLTATLGTRGQLIRPASRGGIPQLPMVREARKAERSQRKALAELKSGVMMLLADGLDIGELRVSDLIDLHPREINPSRVGANGHRPRVHRQRANAGELQRKAAKELELLAAYDNGHAGQPATW